MSGHSKWASIKHKKAATDSKRGQMFNKLIREITVAARMGGGDPDTNARLRLVMQKAKEINMPTDNVTRAIKRGTGELEGVSYEESSYEGYGPNGTAVLIDVLTDNKNRTTSEIRMIFSKNSGNLGSNGCVAWMFAKKGLVSVKNENIKEDDLFNIVVDAGAEDLMLDSELNIYEITCEPENLEKVKKALSDKKIPVESSELSKIPKSYIKIAEEGKARQMARLISELEGHDDVQNVYTNADIPDSAFEGV
ncbi:MAG: YebC/PmpR family DNA-binding transcriptional regulator [bacterium]|nr:YebC/PmpR family DNA-binding transcriptional regulator [bacterium]